MLNEQDSNMAANAICHAVLMMQYSIQQAAECYTAPHVIHKPRLLQEGDQWCALLGDNLQSGICGFGNSPAEAMQAFDKEWHKPIAAARSKV